MMRIVIIMLLGCGSGTHMSLDACATSDQIHFQFSATQAGVPGDASAFDATDHTWLPHAGLWSVSSSANARAGSITFFGLPAVGNVYPLVASFPPQAGQANLSYSDVVQGRTVGYPSLSGTVTITRACGAQLAFAVERAVLGNATSSFIIDGTGTFFDITRTGDRDCSSDGALLSCGTGTCPLGAWCDGGVCKCGDQPLSTGCTCDIADDSHPGCGLVDGCP